MNMLKHRYAVAVLLLIVSLLLTSAAMAAGSVLVTPRSDDLLMSGDLVDSETQVIVLTPCTAKVQREIATFLEEKGAPEAMYGKYKRMKAYSAEKLKTWTKSTAALTVFVSQLRQLQADEIRFYVDPSQTDLYAWTKDMLMQAAQECADPTHRGSDAYPNIYGCQPTLVTDAATGEQTAVTPSDWFQKLQAKWGELQSP